jgi:hypothetical protein
MFGRTWLDGFTFGLIAGIFCTYGGLVYYVNVYGKCYKSFCLIPLSAAGIN